MSFKAVSVVGIMSVDTGIQQLDEGTDLKFIDSFLEKHKHGLCTIDDPCFVAYDDTAAGIVPLTTEVRLGDVTPISRSKRHITFIVPYSVKDAAGNAAGPLNLTLEVELVDVKDHLSGALISVRKQDYFGVFTFLVTVIVILCVAYLRKIMRAMQVALHAIQFAMYPYTLMARRRDFEDGMDLVLQVMSLGMMSKTDRMRRIAIKWNNLVEAMDSQKDDEN
ncbi:unnamed protein product [Symbiodinium microadriaticum]|nr:unnamed protein product [Symbiodinium microadriaticum]